MFLYFRKVMHTCIFYKKVCYASRIWRFLQKKADMFLGFSRWGPYCLPTNGE